jgi:hypothetical protein
MLETIIKLLRRFRSEKRGVSNVIVVMLSLILVVVIASNVILWSYQMNQLDWEKMQENLGITNVERINRSSWFVAQSEYTVNDGSHVSGSYADTQAVDSQYERFTEVSATPPYYPNGYNVLYGTHLSGTVPGSVQTVDSDYFIVRSTGTASSTTAYNPSGYNLFGSTTLVSGTTGDLTSNNGVYMTFRSYENTTCKLQYYNSSDGESSSNSGTYADKVILTFIPSLTGNYLIIASAELRGSSNAYDVRVRMTIDGTTYANPTWQPDEANMWESFFTSKVINFDSNSHTIRVQYSSENTAQTVTIRRARIMALKLLDFESNEVESQTAVTSSSYVDIVTKTFSPSTAGVYLIVATAEVEAASTSNSIYTRLQIDGVAKDEMITVGETTTDYEVFAAHNVTALSATSHTITIQARRGGGSGTMYIRRARITAVRLSDYYDYQTSGSEGLSSTSLTSWQDKTVLTFTPSSAGNYLIMATAKINLNTASNGYQPAIDFTIDGTEYGFWQAGLSASSDYLTFATMINASLSAASHTLKISYRTTSATYTANIRDARIVAVKLAKQYVSEVEFTGSSNTEAWAQLEWTIDSAWTVGSVTVTIQVYNYTLGGYPTSGNGYASYISSSTASVDETTTQTVTINPTHFRDSSSNWKIKVKGVKISPAQFDFKADWIEFKTTYYNEYTASTEFTFSNMTTDIPGQLNFTVVSEYDIANVSVTIQVWNYSSSAYVNSGEGYLAYTSSGSNETKLLSINTDPQFYISNGNAKIKITGVKSTTSQYLLKINQIKLYKIGNSLNISGGYVIDLSTYPLAYIQTVEIQLRYRASDSGEKWYLKAYNWSEATYSDVGFNSTIGHTPTTDWDYYAVNLTTSWRSYVWNNGTIYVQLIDQSQDINSTTIDIDFLGVRTVIDGTRFSFKNDGALTSHLISIWVNNATSHRRYAISLFVNSGESVTYTRLDTGLPTDNFVVKVVTERGNIAVYTNT